MKNLDKLFNPKSVAIIGASNTQGKVGYEVVNNLKISKFAGQLFPINPNDTEVLGLKAYKNIDETPADVDLAIFCIPSKAIISTIEQTKKKIDSAIIITAGFKEAGPDGVKLEENLKSLCEKKKINVVGPNCLGILVPESKLNASFAADMPIHGHIAFFSQSGALGTAVLDWAIAENIGFSKFISMGNKMDIDEVDMIEALGADPDTKVILGYIEGVKDGRRFMDSAKKVSKTKPIIITKSGATTAGAKAASSHTGSLAGSDKAFDAAFKQTGIIRTKGIEELFDFAVAFGYQPIPKGDKVAILTNAGGPGIIATDAVEQSSVKMAAISESTVSNLRPKLTPTAALGNPVDVIGDAKTDRYKVALDALMEDPNIDGFVIILTPQAMTEIDKTAEMISEVSKMQIKPVLASFMGGLRVKSGIGILGRNMVPNYAYPDRAVKSFEAMVKYRSWQTKPESSAKTFIADKDTVAKTIKNNPIEIGETDAKNIMNSYGFRIPKSILVSDEKDLQKAVKETGFPIVMKISSPDILHKSDAGGVKVGIKDEKEALESFNTIISNAKKYKKDVQIDGVLVQETIVDGKQVILGVSKDTQFGHMIMFGLGGIYVEVLKDVSFRIAPITETDAREMIAEIKTYKLLTGVRGEESVDIDAIVDSLLKLSQLVTEFPQIKELDINPLTVMPKSKGGAVALDARIALEE